MHFVHFLLCSHSLSFTSLPVAVEWFSVMKLWLRSVKHNENVSYLGNAGHWSSKGHSMHKFCKFIGETMKWIQILEFLSLGGFLFLFLLIHCIEIMSCKCNKNHLENFLYTFMKNYPTLKSQIWSSKILQRKIVNTQF